jgi:NAD(P)-dependent dehydrogenase (short-subunit alcohol dehydrogenase family)
MGTDGTVFITGASSGFGRLTAEMLARKGYTVVAGIRDRRGRNGPAGDELARLATEESLDLFVVELDVNDDASVQIAVAEALELREGIDVVVNNAGIVLSGPNEAFTIDQVRAAFETNVFGALRMNRAVLPHMRDRGSGLLIHVSAIPGRVPVPLFGVFSATKAALEALAETYRYELAALGIDSVVIEPAMRPTPIWTKVHAPADEDRLAGYGALMKKAAELSAATQEKMAAPDAPDPQDVADAVVALIEMAHGQRPLRTVVCKQAPGDAARTVNAAQARAQALMLEALGLADLTPTPEAEVAQT